MLSARGVQRACTLYVKPLQLPPDLRTQLSCVCPAGACTGQLPHPNALSSKLQARANSLRPMTGRMLLDTTTGSNNSLTTGIIALIIFGVFLVPFIIALMCAVFHICRAFDGCEALQACFAPVGPEYPVARTSSCSASEPTTESTLGLECWLTSRHISEPATWDLFRLARINMMHHLALARPRTQIHPPMPPVSILQGHVWW